MIDLDYQVDDLSSDLVANLPSYQQIKDWLNQAIDYLNIDRQLSFTLCLVDGNCIRKLNNDYRQKDSKTNVLSFPFEFDLEAEIDEIKGFLGDVILAVDVVLEESNQQNKTFIAHFAHLVLHGFLHLLGYDHLTDHQANEMESHEKAILQQWGFANPYDLVG